MRFKPKDRVKVIKTRKLYGGHTYLGKIGEVTHASEKGYHILMDTGKEATFFEDELEAL